MSTPAPAATPIPTPNPTSSSSPTSTPPTTTTTSTTTTNHRRPLAPTALATALKGAKPLILTAETSSTSSRSSRSAASSSSSTSSSSITSLSWNPQGTLLAVSDTRGVRVWNPEKPGVRYSTELKVMPASSSSSTSGSGAGGAGGGSAAPPPPTTSGRRAPQPTLVPLSGTEAVAFNPNSEATLATVGSDAVLRVWDVRGRGLCITECRVGEGGLGVVWHPGGGECVVLRKDDVVVVVRVSGIGEKGGEKGGEKVELKAIAHHDTKVQTNSITFSNAGSEIFTTTGDSTVRVYSYPEFELLQTFAPHTSSISCVSQSPSGRLIAFGGSDALMSVWDTSEWVVRNCFSGLGGPVRNVSWSWDGAFVVGGCGGDEVVATGSGGGSGSATPSSSSTSLGGGAAGGTGELTSIKVYHAESGEEVVELETKGPTPCVAWHPSRYCLAWGGEPGGVRVLGIGAL